MSTTPYMNLSIPDVGVTIGPLWATMNDAAFEAIDAHDHSSGKGVRVTPAGINVNADLDCGSNNLTSVRSLRLDNQGTALAGVSDVSCFYSLNGDAYWRNASGADIRLTIGGLVNAGAASVVTHSQLSVASNIAISAGDSYVTYLVNTSSARTITLPAANAVGAGRYYTFIDTSGSSETNAITIARTGTDLINGLGASFTLAINRGVWTFESNGGTNWYVSRSAPANLTKSTLTLGTSVLTTSSIVIGGGASLTTTVLTVGTSTLTTSLLTVAGGSTLSGTTLTAATVAATTVGATTANLTTANVTTLNVGTNALTATALTIASGTTATVASGATLALPAGSSFTRGGTGVMSLVDVQSTGVTFGGPLLTTTSSSYQDVPTVQVTMTAQAGDVFVVNGSAYASSGAGQCNLSAFAGSTQCDASEILIVASTTSQVPLGGTYTAAGSGSLTFKFKGKSPSNVTCAVYGANIRVQQFRP